MDKLFKKYKWLKKYFAEIILLTAAFLVTIVSLIIFNINSQPKDEEEIITNQIESQDLFLQNIFIDVSGEVLKPDVYKVKSGTRLKEIMDLAGGLSKNADDGFFNRNYNLSRILVDQEKIYVPSVWEVNNGYFIENRQTLDFIYPAVTISNNEVKADLLLNNPSQINLNLATLEELDILPGIGKVTAEKIINNRPYSTIEELVTKKAVNKSVFEKIKNLISI